MQCLKKVAQQQSASNTPVRQGAPQQALGGRGQAYNCNTSSVTKTKTLASRHMHWHYIVYDTPRMHSLG
jgi:hypothetical protein